VKLRPYVKYFLKEMSKVCELVIFTAARMDYADIILNEVDKDKKISHRLYRQHITKYKQIQIKDLSLLGRDLKKVVIIDNLKENFSKQSENGLKIGSFYGEDSDSQLLEITRMLCKIFASNHEDIRDHLQPVRDTLLKERKISDL
jgi:Dullard-like phosphatase family protein